MRKRQAVLTAALSLVLVMGFTQWVIPTHAITWGEPDDARKPLYPEVGAIIAPLEGWGHTPVCSGILIHPKMFLTAGHCTDWLEHDYELDEVSVSFDYAPPPSKPGRHAVAQIITHPNYDGWVNNANPYDVGLLILKKPVKNISPATLPHEGFLDELQEAGLLRIKDTGPTRAMFTVVGYGATEGMPPPYFYYEDVRQYASSQFQDLLKAWLRLSQNNNICDDIGGTCFGDSGGPAFWVDNDQRILVGITSWGDAVCVSAGFNYRVDIPDTLDFIAENTPKSK